MIIIQTDLESIILGEENFYNQDFFLKTVRIFLILEVFLTFKGLRRKITTTTDKMNSLLLSFAIASNNILRFIILVQNVFNETIRSGTYYVLLLGMIGMVIGLYPLVNAIRTLKSKTFETKKQLKITILSIVLVFIALFSQMLVAFFTYPLKIF